MAHILVFTALHSGKCHSAWTDEKDHHEMLQPRFLRTNVGCVKIGLRFGESLWTNLNQICQDFFNMLMVIFFHDVTLHIADQR